VKKILFLALALIIAALFIGLSLEKRYYNTVTREELIGVVRCVPAPRQSRSFTLFYIPVNGATRSDFKMLAVTGDEWLFEGEIIKWKKGLTFLGITTAQRSIRIGDLNGNTYSLEEKKEGFWFQLGRYLPLVDTSFRSLVKGPCQPKEKFGIYATNTGYLIRKIRN